MEKMYKAEFYLKKIKEVDAVSKTDVFVEYLDDDNRLRRERKKTKHYCFTGTHKEAIDAILQVLRENVSKAESTLAIYQDELDAFLAANVIDQNSPS
jgi:hypothetical protein